MKMKSIFFLYVIILLQCSCGISEREWIELKKRLAEINKRDQRYRPSMDSLGKVEGWQSKKMEVLWEKQRTLDSVNLVEVESIVDKFGYPPKEKVGDQVETVFQVLQHSAESTMADYYVLIVAAGKNGDLKMKEVAPYQDRVLMTRDEPQEYGSQIWIDFKVDSKTGERYDSLYLWKVRDPQHVNERRIAAGLDSLATYLRRFDIDQAKGYLIRKSSAIPTSK